MSILLRDSQIIELTTTDTVQPEVQSMAAVTTETTISTMSWLKTLVVLFKLRIVVLLLFILLCFFIDRINKEPRCN